MAFARLADHLLVDGSDGLVVAGTTGESPTLTDDEKVALFRHAVEVATGRGPVIADTGSNDTAHRVALTRRAEDAGVDGVLVVTPYYNRPPERGLRAHFAAVAARHQPAGDRLQHPVALRREPLARAASPTSRRSTTSSPSNRPTPTSPQSRRLRELCDLGLYAGNDDMTLRRRRDGRLGLHLGGQPPGGRRASRSWCWPRAPATGARAPPIDTELAPLFAALFITTNPIPAQGGAEPARPRGRRPAPAAGRSERRRTARHRGRARAARPADCQGFEVAAAGASAGARGLADDKRTS